MKQCLNIFIEQLRDLQHDLSAKLRTNEFIHDKILRSCCKMSACKYACNKFNKTVLNLISDLRSSIIIEIFFNKSSEIYFIDRRYHTSDARSNKFQRSRFQFQHSYELETRDRTTKQCFVCEKKMLINQAFQKRARCSQKAISR